MLSPQARRYNSERRQAMKAEKGEIKTIVLRGVSRWVRWHLCKRQHRSSPNRYDGSTYQRCERKLPLYIFHAFFQFNIFQDVFHESIHDACLTQIDRRCDGTNTIYVSYQGSIFETPQLMKIASGYIPG